ncbi:hypothetical protein CMK11_10180 [Candidatus Poribacteria bacterium]|nr:hypothetical protein [Candidatus Poribacteria bacterium]
MATGNSYRVIDAGTWRDGQAKAADQGARLVTIDDAAEQRWLVSTFGGTEPLWIGLTDAGSEGKWRWAGGEPASYTNWASREPNNMYAQGEHFVHMNWLAPGKWNDLGPGSAEWRRVTRAIIERNGNITSNDQPWKRETPSAFDITGRAIAAPAGIARAIPSPTTFAVDIGDSQRWFGEDLRNSHRGAEIVWDPDVASNVIQFTRVGGGSSGSHVGIVRDVNIDVSEHADLRVQVDVKSVSHNLRGGGWAGGSEYPVCVELAYIDQNGTPHRWRRGFYSNGADTHGTSTKVPQGAWHTYTSPRLAELAPLCADAAVRAGLDRWFHNPMHAHDSASRPARITRVALFGAGWDFNGRADNLRFVEASDARAPGVTPMAARSLLTTPALGMTVQR